MDGALAFLIVVWTLCAWAMFCNHRTYAQRTALSDAVFAAPNWRELLAQYDAATYNQHMWRLMTLRNPMTLYAATLRESAHVR